MPNTTITLDLDDDEYAHLANALGEYRDSWAAKVQQASEEGTTDPWASTEMEAIEELIAKIERAVDDA